MGDLTNNFIRKLELHTNRNFYLLLFILGLFLNEICFVSNGLSMPVRTEYTGVSSGHYTYTDTSKVKFWVLSDVVATKAWDFLITFSIGDAVAAFSFIMLVV